MTVNVLVSYGYAPGLNLSALRRGLGCGRIMVDSGAFSAHTSGKTVTLDGYARHLDRWAGCWDHAITLDVIGDPVGTHRNTRRLHERGYPVMPVFTLGGRLAEFDAMVRDSRYVAVGGLVGLSGPTVRARIAMLQRRGRDGGGGIHALGVSSVEHLLAARPYSADASTASSGYRFGTVTVFDGRSMRGVSITNRAHMTLYRDLLAAQGIDVATLLRTRRMPSGEGRHKLTAAMFLGYACADEVLHRRGVPAPAAGAPTGTVLYIAVSEYDLPAVLAAARMCHGVDPPRAWRRLGRDHRCHPATAVDTGESA